MATATITLTDSEDGQININVSFDPPVTTAGEATPAQYVALKMLQAAKGMDAEEEGWDEA